MKTRTKTGHVADGSLREQAQPAGRDNAYSLKRLGFADPALEHAFRESEWRKNHFLRWMPAIAIGIWMAFSIFDYFIAREAFGILFTIRLVCAAYLLVLGFFAIRDPLHYEISLSLMSYGATLGLVSMVFVLDREQSAFYFTGMMITMYMVQLWFHLPLRAALVNCLVSFLLYIPIPFALSLPARIVLGHLMYMASFAVFTVGGIWFFERSLRRQFLAERESQNAKEQAEAATLLKDQFVTLVSHDLKTPILSIRGAIDLVTNGGIRQEERINDLLGQASHSADGLLRMIDQLLQHNSLKSGKNRAEKRFHSASRLAGEQIQRVGLAAKNKDITLVNDLPPDMLVFVDGGLFGQALNNLLSNAVKFTPKGGSVRLFAPQPGKPVVAVRDTGVGLPPDMLASLFQADAHSTTVGTAGEKGFGLGLSYAQAIVRTHGGTLAGESQPGKGSTFTISLPEHRAVVMVVDDLPLHRERVKGLLANLDSVEVIEAGNGREAWENLTPVAPDLVITDIQMPEMDGYAFLVKMRREEAFRPIPVIVLSAQTELPGESAERDKAILAGADEFLSKTATDSAILDAIHKYIRPFPS